LLIQQKPLIISKAKFKIQPNINSFQVRAYYDVLKLNEDANFYLGTGLGISQVKNAFSFKLNDNSQPNIDREGVETKSKNNFTWMIGLGADFKMSERIKFALEYNYSDFGKAKSVSDSKLGSIKKNPSFGVHSLLAKISLDI
jgi:opacity protein-like surface antigen